MKKYLYRSPRLLELLWRCKELALASYRLTPSTAERRCRLLREFLRMCPTWVGGHLRLGESALLAYESVERSKVSRMLATAEMSLVAMKQMHRDAGTPVSVAQIVSQATIEVGVLFLKRAYPEALHAAETLLAQYQTEIAPTQRKKLFQQAGAAAMALDLNEKALLFFSAIPSELRTAEDIAALDYLEQAKDE